MQSSLRALLFDFDGLIVDTEWPIYQAWCQTFRDYGHPLSLETFNQCIGTNFDTWSPKTHLEELTGSRIDWDPLDSA
ncbi:MAG: HAD hydrolase-like protein, partial [Roseibacillus sp.]|nr:HAD hydrolase-like protein [Roseibacillus sp.]